MKLKRLTIHNIASIEDATIDFSGDILGSQEMFLICGPTGAGKTTILDAICVALFEKTPRIESTQKNQTINFASDEGRDVINEMKSVLHLVRKNAVEASITLTFDGVDGREYTVTWRVFRKGQYRERNRTVNIGGIQKTVKETYVAKTFQNLSIEDKLSRGFNKEWTLTDDCGNDTIKDVKNAIIEVIGMTFDQFCKTTMLAQGDFTKFLASPAEEKAIILEKLVRSEEYAKVGKIINATANALKNEVEWRMRELQEYKFLSDQERHDRLEEIAAINKRLAETDKLISAIGKKLQWIRDMDKAAAAERSARQGIAEAQALYDSEEATKHRNICALWDTTAEVRNAISECERCRKAAISLDGREAALATRYDIAVAAAAHILQVRADIIKANEDIRAGIEAQRPFDSMLTNADIICSAHADICGNEEYIANARPIIEEQDMRIGSLRQQLENLQQEQHRAMAEIRELEQRTEELKSRLKDNGADTIDQEITELISHKELVAKAETAYAIWREAHNEHQTKLNNLNEAEKLKEQYTEEEARLKKLYDEAQAQAAESDNAYQRTKAAISDHAKALRAELKAGDLCPVCGNRVSEIVDEQGYISALQPIREKVERDTKRAKELAEEYAVAKASLRTSDQQTQKAKKEEKAAQKKLQNSHKAFTDLCAELWVDTYGDFQDALDKLKAREREKEANITARQNVIKDIRDQIDKLAAHTDNIRKQRIKTLEDSATKLQKEIGEAEKLKSEKAGGIVKATQSIAEKQKAIQSLVNPQWHPHDESRYYQELKDCAKKYTDAKTEHAANESKIQSLDSTMDLIKHLREDIETSFAQWSDRVPAPVAAVDDISAVWTTLQRDARTLATAIGDNARCLERANATIREYTEANGGIDAVTALMEISESEISRIKDGIAKLADDLAKAKGQLEAAIKGIAELGESPLVEEENGETLSAQQDTLNKQKDEASQRKGAIQSELDNDMRSRQLMSDKKEALDRLRTEYSEWDELNKYLGNTDGKNFRNVAQSFILADLLDKANMYLAGITGRYELFCNPGTLTIMLRDAYQGGAVRPTNTLSGGESFIISLSLALGLSSMQNVAMEVDTLFIDEGFGTLSPEFLDPVIDALKRLYHLYGRRVGIISHVETLKSRIPVTIDVTRHGSSRSTVEINVS